jgi:hypothetical protein
VRRTLQLLIIYAAAILCAWLATSCAASPTGRTLTQAELSKGLRHRFPAAQQVLQDELYQLVPSRDLHAALHRARVPYRPDVADCDDLTADTLYHLRRPRYHLPSALGAPAAGRLSAHWRGTRHSLLWHLAESGQIAVLEPYTATPVTDCKPWLILDH